MTLGGTFIALRHTLMESEDASVTCEGALMDLEGAFIPLWTVLMELECGGIELSRTSMKLPGALTSLRGVSHCFRRSS